VALGRETDDERREFRDEAETTTTAWMFSRLAQVKTRSMSACVTTARSTN